MRTSTAAIAAILPHHVVGTFLDVGAVLLGCAIGITAGSRLPADCSSVCSRASAS